MHATITNSIHARNKGRKREETIINLKTNYCKYEKYLKKCTWFIEICINLVPVGPQRPKDGSNFHKLRREDNMVSRKYMIWNNKKKKEANLPCRMKWLLKSRQQKSASTEHCILKGLKVKRRKKQKTKQPVLMNPM